MKKKKELIKDIAHNIVEAVNTTTNDYDARDLVEKELWEYGRCLGTLWVEDIDVNKTLISEGHAVEYHGGKR
jgi:endonuclease YncB( thermonuclease family)